MAYHRISIYMTDEDINDLNRVRAILDPAGILNRSVAIRRTISIVLEDYKRWQEQEAAQQEKNIHGLEASHERE